MLLRLPMTVHCYGWQQRVVCVGPLGGQAQPTNPQVAALESEGSEVRLEPQCSARWYALQAAVLHCGAAAAAAQHTAAPAWLRWTLYSAAQGLARSPSSARVGLKRSLPRWCCSSGCCGAAAAPLLLLAGVVKLMGCCFHCRRWGSWAQPLSVHLLALLLLPLVQVQVLVLRMHLQWLLPTLVPPPPLPQVPAQPHFLLQEWQGRLQHQML